MRDIQYVRGDRKSPHYVLTESDIILVKNEIKVIEADITIFHFNHPNFTGTCYSDKFDIINIAGNIFPDLISGSTHPRDIMSVRAVLAHEYYGHRLFRGTHLPIYFWEDEYRASRTAAEITPNLTDEERRHLVMDALERKREAGVEFVLDDFEKKTLYGEIF